jgi:hypothetical protein
VVLLTPFGFGTLLFIALRHLDSGIAKASNFLLNSLIWVNINAHSALKSLNYWFLIWWLHPRDHCSLEHKENGDVEESQLSRSGEIMSDFL